MAAMKEGILMYDQRQDRYDVRFDIDDYYGSLHCGEYFDVFINGEWIPTHIEYGGSDIEAWYLVGLHKHTNNNQLDGLKIRMS